MGERIKRRTFLKTLGLSSIALVPGADILGGLVSQKDRQRLGIRGHDLRFIDYACNILQFRNLLYLECYFLNVVHSPADNALFPLLLQGKDVGDPQKISQLHSYMVVRLPQQHITEEFKTIDELQHRGNERVFAKSTISGYSFLVFEINFGLLKAEGGLPLTAATLLNWNAPWFTLAVTENPRKELFDVVEQYDPPDPRDGLKPQLNGYPLGYREDLFQRNAFPQYGGHRLGNYPYVSSRPAKTNYFVTADLTISAPVPVTAIEVPYRLILSPKLPDKDAYVFFWTFSIPGVDASSNGAELWTAKLQIKKSGLLPHIPKDPKAELNKSQQNKGQENMELMIIGSPDYDRRRYSLDFCSTQDELCEFKRLPCAKDRSDLVKLYMLNRIAARTPSLSFSPIGVSTYISFLNNNFQNNGVTLYQWDQQISYGRDQQVIVSRIVVDACFGLKMLHIQMTARETFQDQSLLVYREYVKPLDPDKNFSLYDSGDLHEYKDVNQKFNQPYKKIQFKDGRAVEIQPVAELSTNMKVMATIKGQDPKTVCDCADVNDKGETVVAFWPVTPDGKLVTWEMLYDDWHTDDNPQTPVDPSKCSCHQLFLLAGDLANNPDDSFMFKAPDTDNPGAYLSFADLYGKVFVPATDTQVAAPFNAYKDVIASLVSNKIQPSYNQIWLQILQKTEDFELQKTELYRDFLDRSIAGAENLLKSRAKNIVDRVMDQWNIFKRRALNSEKDILSLLGRFHSLLDVDRNAVTVNGIAYTTLGTIQANCDTLKARILQDIQADRARALAAINSYKQQMLDSWNAVQGSLNDITFINDLRTTYADTKTRIGNYVNYISQFQDLPSVVDSLGIEYAWAVFQGALPGGFIRAVSHDLEGYVDNIKAVFHEIQGVEENLRSKVNAFGAKVGYAVGKVEEELTDLKNRIRDEAAKAGQIGDEWEQKYDKLRKLYHADVNEKMSALKTEYILYRNNYRQFQRDFDLSHPGTVVKQVFNFFDEHACFPQLHTAKVYVDRVNDLVHREIPLKVKYAKDYVENQVNNTVFQVTGNASRVFLEIKADGKELIRGAVREMGKELGGLVSPELAADFLTYAKDIRDTTAEMNQIFDQVKGDADVAIAQKLGQVKSTITDATRTFNNELDQYKDYLTQGKNNLVLLSKEAVNAYHEKLGEVQTAVKQKEDEAKAYFQQLEAKIIGAIHIRDIIGDGAMLPRIDRQTNKIYYTFVTKQLVSPPPNSIFSFTPQLTTNGGSQDASLAMHFEKSLVDPKDYTAWTRLSNFTVGVFEERIIIGFQKLEMVSNQQVKNKVSVAIEDVHFQKELAFIESLSKNIKMPGSGLSLSIHPRDISIDFSYALPDISGGAFNFFNVKFHVGVIIPFPIGSNSSVNPITASFGINAPDDKFVLGVGIWGGRGHCVLEVTPKYIKRVDIGMDYGGLLALNLGIAKGQAFLMAGVRYVYERDDFGQTTMELYSLLTCGGSVTVFGFITISVVFLLCLKYQNTGGVSSLYGMASVTYSIQIGFFKKSFSLSFSKRLYGSDSQSPPPDDYGCLQGAHPENKLYQLAGYKKKQNDPLDEYVFGPKSLKDRYLRPESRRIFTIYRF